MTDFETIRQLIDDAELEAAREALVDYLYQDYDSLEAWLLLTECALDRDEYTRAVKEALRVAPDNPQARRLAKALAQERARQTGIIQPTSSSPWRPISNLFIFLLVVIIGAALVFVLLGDNTRNDENGANSSGAVADPNDICLAVLSDTYQRLEARCALLNESSACLANPEVSFSSNQDVSFPQLPGDRIALNNITAINNTLYEGDSQTWGLSVLRSSENIGYQMVLTSGVRLSDFDDDLSRLNFASNPAFSVCDHVPPSGLLLYSLSPEPDIININGLNIILRGTAFLQVDAAAGLRIVVLEGDAILSTEGVNTTTQISLGSGQWVSVAVDSFLNIDAPLEEAMIGDAPIRGDLEHLRPLADALTLLSSNWILPAGTVTVAIQPTPTATRGIRILSPTPTPSPSRTPRESATPRPTRTPTNSPVPTSTDIPVLESTAANLPSPTPTLDFDLESSISGTWACIATIDRFSFPYVLTIEPLLQNDEVLASAILPSYGDTVVALRGVEIRDRNALGNDWEDITNYQEGDLWLFLQETEIIYALPSEDYSPNGAFRLVFDGNQLNGGIFDQNRFIGSLNACEFLQ